MPKAGSTFHGRPDMSGASLEEARSCRSDRMLSKSSLLIFCVTELGNAVWNMRAPVKLFSCGRVTLLFDNFTANRTLQSSRDFHIVWKATVARQLRWKIFWCSRKRVFKALCFSFEWSTYQWRFIVAFFNATGVVTDDGNSIIISSLQRIQNLEQIKKSKTKIQKSLESSRSFWAWCFLSVVFSL